VPLSLARDEALTSAIEKAIAAEPKQKERREKKQSVEERESSNRSTDALGSRHPSVVHPEESIERNSQELVDRVARTVLTKHPAVPEKVHTLALTLMRVAGLVAATHRRGARRGMRLGLFGAGKPNDVGGHWTGRPHVHLIRFADQANRASDNEARFDCDFGAILARFVPQDRELGRKYLPKSSRSMDDFAVYLTEALTLWVYPSQKNSSGSEKEGDPNRDKLVHEHQVKAELLEYGYALHRRIAERATNPKATATQLFFAERDLSGFDWSVQDTGRFGEIKDMLADGLVAFKVPALQARIAELIRVRRELAVTRAQEKSYRWTGVLTIVAGFLAVPALADVVVKPLFRRLGWWLPQNADSAQLFSVVVATVGTALILSLGYWWSNRSR
jgi:hypothetical protein